MICKCGMNLPTKAKFCSECGISAPIVETKIEIQPIKQVSHILTVNEASDFFKISRSKLYELVSQNAIPWFPVGSHKRFLAQELLNWAKKRTYESEVIVK